MNPTGLTGRQHDSSHCLPSPSRHPFTSHQSAASGGPAGSARDLVVQPVKATLAASAAWLLADLAGPVAAFYAPMAALLMVQSTVYRSVYTAVRQLVAVLLGILIAMAVGRLFVVSPWSVALVVLPALGGC